MERTMKTIFRYYKIIVVFRYLFMLLILVSCEINHGPTISDITCNPDSGGAGTDFYLKVYASDPDGDLLIYSWKADEGTFISFTNSSEVQWRSPVSGAGKECQVSVTISDGQKEVSRSHRILLGDPELGSIRGMINFNNIRVPIEGVSLNLGGKTTTSDSDGIFVLSGIPAIEDTLRATKQDYSVLELKVKVPVNDTIKVSLEMASIKFSSKISGIVKDIEGIVLQNVSLSVLNPDGSSSKIMTTTDESGFYRLLYVPWGQRTIVAIKESDDDFSYTSLTTTTNISEMQTQLNLVMEKTCFNGQFIDIRDQHKYSFRTIGTQVWMTENLAYLPFVNPSNMVSSKIACYYVYGFDGTDTTEAKASENYQQYGVLYNWKAVESACPIGWHVPSSYEWDVLFNFLEPDAAVKMKSMAGWSNHGNGSNASRFNAWPAGQLNTDRVYSGDGLAAYFWTTTIISYLKPGVRSLKYDSNSLSRISGGEKLGYSIRCVKNH